MKKIFGDGWRRVGGCGGLLAAVWLAACTPEGAQQEVEFRVPVAVEEVGTATLENRIVTTGTLRPPEVVTLSVLDSGVLEINRGPDGHRLAEGDTVKAGSEIARIIGEDVRITARVAAAQRAFDAASAELLANREIFKRGLINRTTLDATEMKYENAKIDIEHSRRTEDRNRMVTPIDGVVLKLARDSSSQLLANGQLVSIGQVVAQIAPLDPLIADVDLIGDDIALVRVGLEARARYHAWGDTLFPGKVLRLAPTVDQRTRALRAEVQIENTGQRLRPGMFVEVTLVGERRENVPVVPRGAVTERGGRRVVFVLASQRVVMREVQIGLGDDTFLEIRRGVEAGERVVVRGLETLTDQMLVRVTNR
ncbi:MAG TPA: efflux RND transporter periplasmic adaptor subunit [Gammaproteobacteria bacterium]|nr:efflux RND transporter periplasmic adaptor subunit [Gammaproteobacteria bacterium]